MALPFGNITANYLTGSYSSQGAQQGLGNFIRNLVTATFLVSGLATFVFLIIGGLRYLTAGGDAKAMEAATKIITSAVVGLAIIIVAYAIARIIGTVFGINIFQPTFVGP